MAKYHALFNPLACNGLGGETAKKLDAIYGNENMVYRDIRKIEDYRYFFAEIPNTDSVILCGGDGTINRFINATKGIETAHEILYYPCGSGNDFWRDIGGADRPVRINEYIKRLPTVVVNGEEYAFINGVGYGIDGYCCEVGDRIRREDPKKTINYGGIAVKGLLFHYAPTRATVTVDGVEHVFEKAWLVPTMYGRFYGGGMMATPDQDRNAEDKTLSVLVFHGSGRLKTLTIFPSIFKGEHVKHTKHVTVLTGKEIRVSFDRPVALQIDGETLLDISEYSAKAEAPGPAEV